ncbi:MarP family serine protease [Microbacterium sp.]|uniref:MarP family serine protease n=1 Tax=Microbacterium sp. TaxID=51671 RepID=UPI00281224DC|nr:MarP family serine protease [Microbacterium sp.]
MPNLVDLLIAVLLIAALATGLSVGLFSVLGALCGLVAGALAAPWVLPWVARALPESEWHGLIVIGSAVVLLLLGVSIGSAIGALVRRGADRLRLRIVERMLGGLTALVAGTLAIAMTGAAVASAGVPVVSSAVASSVVLRTIDRYTPAPLAEAAARLHALVLGDSVLPTIEGLLDPQDLDAAPDAGAIDIATPEVRAAAASVARISGVAHQCSTIPTGSGFVIAEDRILTNAHVVAGVDAPVVELPGEPARDGRVVYFDPVDDIAVVAADVDARPLALADALAAGDGGAVLGYPYGGPFRTVPAGVVSTVTAPVDDIYGQTAADRGVYVLRSDINPGNSGGPLLTQDGGVVGMVFAKDQVKEDVGYAMTNDELLPVISGLDAAQERVATGACIG